MIGRIRYAGERVVEVQVRFDPGPPRQAVVVDEVPAGLALELVTEKFTLPINKALTAGDSLTFPTEAWLW